MTLEERKDLWKKVLIKLEPQMRSSDFRTWLRNTAILMVERDTLTVGCPSDIVRTQLAAKYHSMVLKAAQGVQEEIIHIDYKVDSSLADGSEAVVALGSITGVIKRAQRKEQVEGIRVSEGVTSRMLNPDYTFDNFVVGIEDRIAYAAAQVVAEKPGKVYNPLFIYGGVGLGKTHLVQAIGNAVAKQKNRIVVYVSSEKLVNEIIAGIRSGQKRMDRWREQYRKVDLLIVDDIQFLSGKSKTQDEFFHTFNILYEANKQIVLTADRPPKELIGIEDRLVSRFGSGMVADVNMPAYETRVAILQHFAAREGVLLSPDVMDLIANNIRSSIRDLRAVVVQIAARIKLSEQIPDENWMLTTQNVADILVKNGTKVSTKTQMETGPMESMKADDFIRAAAHYFQLKAKDVVGSSRKKEVTQARSIAMWLVRNELKYGFEKIGHAFGNRNHATAMHAVNKVQEEMNREPGGSLSDMVAAVKRRALEERMGQ